MCVYIYVFISTYIYTHKYIIIKIYIYVQVPYTDNKKYGACYLALSKGPLSLTHTQMSGRGDHGAFSSNRFLM